MMALIVLVLGGVTAFQSIPRESEPDITAPFVAVTIPLPGVSPEDGERLLIRPTELELQTIEGIVQMDSIASDGVAQIVLEFHPTIEVDQAVLDVRTAVDRAKAEFPTNAEEPIVTEFNLQNMFPIVSLVLHSDGSERTLFQAAQKLEDRIDGVPGVLEANLVGAREELLEIIIDPRTLESYGLSEIEVINAVTANNRLVTAGSINSADGRFTVKTPGLVKNAEDLAVVAVRVNGDNVVTIGDLGEVRRTFKDRTAYSLYNGRPAISVEVSKRVNANIVETIQLVKEAVADETKYWPSTIKVDYLTDQSLYVQDNLRSLTASIFTAVFLVMIAVLAALGMRSALMIGFAIPASFLIGLFFLNLTGVTLNMMVMFGMILAVGMLVDGAIVIIEYADRRMAEGANREEAYKEASKRMFWPVITSTATTLAAFVPFLFWESIPGQFMKYLPITLIFVLCSSLAVALVFLPVIGSLAKLPDWLKKRFKILGKTDLEQDTAQVDEVDPLRNEGLIGTYTRFLRGAMQRPFLIIIAALVVVVIARQSFVAASPDVEFFIRNDSEDVNVLVLARGNLSAEQKLEIAQEVAGRIEDHPAIEYIYIRSSGDLGVGRNVPPELIGQLNIGLIDYAERDHSYVVLDDLRQLVRGIPGAIVEVRQREGGPPVGKDVQIELSSPNYDALIDAGARLRAFVDSETIDAGGQEIPVFMDQEDTFPLPGIEWNYDVDRELAGRYGLSVQQAGAFLQLATDGLLVDKYRPDDADDEIDIRVRYPEQYRNLTGLASVRAQTPTGSVPLSNFVYREPRKQIDRIVRRDGRRIMEIQANGNTRFENYKISQNEAIAITRAWLENGGIGEDVNWRIRGADEETEEASAFFQGAMAAAMFAIAMILLLEFNNFYHAVLTLSAVVLSVFGVLLGIAITGQYVSVIMTGIGIVALAGIVVNNNIVLIDTFQHLRKKGLSTEDAVLRTAAQRIRPVLLTTGTTILGLLPMVFEITADFSTGVITHGSATSSWWVLLSSAVVYGLAFSTMLTLVLTPVMLAAPTVISARIPGLIDRIKRAFNKIMPTKLPGAEKPAIAAPEKPYSQAAE